MWRGQDGGLVPGWGDGVVRRLIRFIFIRADFQSRDVGFFMPTFIQVPTMTFSISHTDLQQTPLNDGIPDLSPSDGLKRIAFFGRRLCDYERIYGFSREELRGQRVLDVGAGSASFAAEAARVGVHVLALDPVYRFRTFSVRDRALRDFADVQALVRSRREAYTMDAYGDEDQFWEARAEARDRFLEDFDSGFAAGRYRAGALPSLELDSGAFDLVLCGHLLFLYAAYFSEAFHLQSLLELVRVARGRVLIYPLVTLSGEPYPGMERLLDRLRSAGVESSLEPVEISVLRGSDQRLVLYPKNNTKK